MRRKTQLASTVSNSSFLLIHFLTRSQSMRIIRYSESFITLLLYHITVVKICGFHLFSLTLIFTIADNWSEYQQLRKVQAGD